MTKNLTEEIDLKLELKFDNVRQYYFRFHESELNGREIPQILINVVRAKKYLECSTLDLVKRNQKVCFVSRDSRIMLTISKIIDSHNECLLTGDRVVQGLITEIRNHIPALVKICEGIAMLDMVSAFAQLATTQDYSKHMSHMSWNFCQPVSSSAANERHFGCQSRPPSHQGKSPID